MWIIYNKIEKAQDFLKYQKFLCENLSKQQGPGTQKKKQVVQLGNKDLAFYIIK